MRSHCVRIIPPSQTRKVIANFDVNCNKIGKLVTMVTMPVTMAVTIGSVDNQACDDCYD